MTTTVGAIQVVATINTKDYDAAKKAIENGNKSIDKNGSDSAKSFEKAMTSAFKVVGVAAVATGAAMATGIGMAIKETAKLEQSLGGSEAVFEKYASGLQKTAQKSFATMGTSMNAYLETANKMGSLFQGAGFSVQQSTKMTQDAMQRATDVATTMGISTEMALESIAGAAKGNFTMMDNLGVAMNDTTLNAYALEKGLGKTTAQMTNAEKVGLAMQMFMDRTSKYAGNYAKENATLSGSFQTLSGAWGNFLAGVEGSDKQLADSIANMVVVLGAQVPGIISNLAGAVKSLWDNLVGANPWISTMLNVLGQVATVIGIMLLPALIRYISLQAIAGTGALIAGAKMVAGWMMALGPIGLIAAAVVALASLIIMNWDWISKTAATLWQGVSSFAADSWKNIQNIFGGVGSWFTSVFTSAVNGIKGVFGTLGGFFRTVWDTIVNMFRNVGTTIGNAIGGAFKGVVNSVLQFVAGFVNNLIDGINGAINVINAIPGVSIGNIGKLRMPMLAEGGIVSRATVAMIGEGREPEAVLPLSKLDRMLENGGSSQSNNSNITINVSGVFATSKQEQRSVAEVIVKRIQEVQKAKGAKVAVV